MIPPSKRRKPEQEGPGESQGRAGRQSRSQGLLPQVSPDRWYSPVQSAWSVIFSQLFLIKFEEARNGSVKLNQGSYIVTGRTRLGAVSVSCATRYPLDQKGRQNFR